MLKPGERAIDRIPESRRPSYFELAEASADQTIALSADVTRTAFFNDLDENQAAAYPARQTPQPLRVYEADHDVMMPEPERLVQALMAHPSSR